MSYKEAIKQASRDEAFKATVYAMNTLLIQKGAYRENEFQQLFTEWVKKEESKKTRARDIRHSLSRGVGQRLAFHR
ncbi:MAG: hypothetical protein WBE13_13190 [Candidatus Acidiferrum sp.]